MRATEFLFREDAYLRSATATVLDVTEMGGVVLDRTVFYAASGGQPGDTGRLLSANGEAIEIVATEHPDGDKGMIVHIPSPGQRSPIRGETLTAEIDWDLRYKLMRMHTALHLLSVVFPFPVTGGAIGYDKGRLDFDMPELPADLDAVQEKLNAMVAADHAVTTEWITDAEMDANPGLVKTMKVKPPTGQGRVRLVRIGDVDLQPCGGTHVRRTGEIGPLSLGKIEKKGRENRRVHLLFSA